MNLHLSQQAPAGPAVESVQDALQRVTEADLRAWVAHLAHPRHRVAQARQNYVDAEWIAARFREWGYHVDIQGPLRNVVATGAPQPSRAILVGAHYDSVPETLGADDNGSAVAALLACAKVCAPMAGMLGLVFVAFNGEEEDLLGSRAFVEQFSAAPRYQIRATHILEMVGYASDAPGSQHVPPGLPIQLPDQGNFLGLVANQHTGAALPTALSAARTYVPDFPVLGLEVPHGLEEHLPVLLRSDHAPFWAAGLPAMMWTDTAEFRNPHYHSLLDAPDTLDYTFLRRVTQVLVATVLTSGLA